MSPVWALHSYDAVACRRAPPSVSRCGVKSSWPGTISPGTSDLHHTGSNGKTTTTSLIAHILETAGLPVQIAGNIGTPLISRVDVLERYGIYGGRSEQLPA